MSIERKVTDILDEKRRKLGAGKPVKPSMVVEPVMPTVSPFEQTSVGGDIEDFLRQEQDPASPDKPIGEVA